MVLIPSFEVEKRTKALNAGVWGFVGVISMFTVGVAVFTSHLMLVSVFDIVSTFISEHMMLAGLVPIMLFACVFGIGLTIFLLSLQTAYVIQPDKIIKGRILNDSGTGDMYSIWRLIALNMEPEFAEQFFFTDRYKRKEYYNPQLIKENKHFYIYSCDDGKLKIRKIYTGMDKDVQNAKAVSIWKRVLIWSVLIFFLFSAGSLVDIGIGLAHNEKHMNDIAKNCDEIEADLADLGYTSKKINNRSCSFVKTVSEQRTSCISYCFKLDGSVEKIGFEIYFDSSSENVEQEIEYIFTALNDGITEQQIEKFVQDTQSTIQGDYIYNKLLTDNYTIVLGTSSSYAHIHN